MRKNKKICEKLRKIRKEEGEKTSNRLNSKLLKKLRKQAEFIPSEKREYVATVHGNKRKTILNKPGSPREVYKFLKKNADARV
jgi:hypothetical protein